MNFNEFLLTLDCYYSNENPFEYSLKNFNKNSFEKSLEIYHQTINSNSNEDLCRIEIYFDHSLNYFTISYGDSFEWSDLLNSNEIRFDYLIVFNENQKEIYSIYEYFCSNQNQCHALFIQNQFDFIQNLSYQSFEFELNLLFSFQIQPKVQFCFNDKMKSEKCLNGSCLGQYSSYYQNSHSQCYQNSATSIEFHLLIHFLIDYQWNNVNFNYVLQYICQTNECNHKLLNENLIEIIENRFPLILFKNDFLKNDSLNLINSTTTNFESILILNSTNENSLNSYLIIDEQDDQYDENQEINEFETLFQLNHSNQETFNRILFVYLLFFSLIHH